MSQKPDNMIVVLDMGSAWTRVLAGDLNEGALRYRGHGIVESAGMRKGLIAELAPAARAVKAASEWAEESARANIDECVVGVGGPHIRGLNTNGGFELSNRMREITREDVRVAVERARAVERPPDREILHLLPTSANSAFACSTLAHIRAAWRCSSRAQWRIRRQSPSAARTLPTTSR
jgi:cell division protein FtsA